MKIWMMAAVLTVVAAASSAEAKGGYKYCLRTSAGPGDCKYQTYEQCRAAMSGTGGTCVGNYGPAR